jgi:transposase
MLGGLLAMSAKEIDRLGVIQRVLDGRLPATKAAVILGVSARQARRLCEAYKASGAAGLISKARGRPSNHRVAGTFERRR